MQNDLTTKNAKTNSGFTLVEMLVVIAITAVLLTLLISPLVNSFRLTQRAQMLVAAQDQGRITLETMSRELGQAAYVFSNTTDSFPQTDPNPNASTIPSLQYSNFLVMDTFQDNGGTYTVVPALAFNAKLDFVLPRRSDTGFVDPTTQEHASLINGSSKPNSISFPLAPGTTMVRYWVGLRDPTKPYSTLGDGRALAGIATGGGNPYVMYRAEFNPTNVDPSTGLPAKNGDGSTVNENLFNTTPGAIDTPEFDDPNFFRNVSTSDVNWLSPTHADYTAAEVTAHNKQVGYWIQIAKPVIGIQDVDLIELPTDNNGDVTFSSGPAGVFATPNANSGAAFDPVAGANWPVVRTSVTFGYGSTSQDASAATTTNNSEAGFGGELAAADQGLPYIPTVYTATHQSWANPYTISLYQYSNNYTTANTPTYQTTVAGQTQSFGSIGSMAAGDIIETMYTNGTTQTPVFDLTNDEPLTTTGQFVPMSVTPDTGTIDFALPALPFPPNSTSPNAYERYWTVDWNEFESSGVDSSGVINLGDNTQLPYTPLPDLVNGTALTSDQVQNARVVPGSVRVYGPDGVSALNAGQSVLYTEVSPGDTDFGPNEYMVNYTNNTITLYVDPATQQLPEGTVGTPANVQVAFDYQANLAPAKSVSTPISSANPAYPYEVKVAYETRDLLNINLGIRVYDPNNVGPATVVTTHNQVRVGNSNR